MLLANWSDVMRAAAFLTVGPVLAIEVNFQFLRKTNAIMIFPVTSVEQSVLRNSKCELLDPGASISPLVKEFANTGKDHFVQRLIFSETI